MVFPISRLLAVSVASAVFAAPLIASAQNVIRAPLPVAGQAASRFTPTQAELVLTPLTHSFGVQPLREVSEPVTMTLTNNMEEPVLIDRLALSGASTNFLLDAAECEVELAPGESCNISVSFYPQTAGLKTAQINVYSADGSRYQVGLVEGMGAVGSLVPSQAQLDFTELRKGEPQTRTITLTNVGMGPAYVQNIVYSGDPEITTDNDCGELEPQQSCTITVTALVNDDVSKRGTLTIHSTNTLSPLQRIQLSATAAQLYAGENPANESPLEVSPKSCNWEGVYLYAVASCQVDIRNTASAPIRFLGGFVTNEHFSASTVACPTELAPGQSCSVTVTFNPRKLGQHEGALNLIAENHDRKTVDLKGQAIPLPVSLSLNRVDFGTVNLLLGGYRTLTITGASLEGAAHFEAGTLKSDNFSVNSACPAYLPRGQSCLLAFQTKSTAKLGEVSENYFFNVNGQRVSIALAARFVTDQLEPSARSLNFETTYVGVPKTKTLSLLNLGTADISLSSIANTNPAFSVSHDCGAKLSRGASCNVSVAFNPDSYGNYSGNLQVVFGSPVQVLNIPLTGKGSAGSVQADVTELNFGEIELGRAYSREITITNTSPITLYDFTVTTANGLNEITNLCPPVLQPGQSCKVVVTISAERYGYFIDALQFSWRGRPALTNKTADGIYGDVGLGAVAHGARLESSVGDLLNFGGVPVGATKTLALQIINVSSEPTIISNPKLILGSANPSSDWSLTHNCANLNPGETCEIEATFSPSRYQILKTAVLEVAHSAGAPLRVRVVGVGEASDVRFYTSDGIAYAIAPDTKTTNVGRAPTGSELEVSMNLRNFGTIGATGIVYETSDKVRGFKYTCESIASETNCTTKVLLNTEAVGEHTAVVKAIHNGRVLTQTFAYRVGGPKMELSAASLDFGSVFIGQRKSLSIELMNVGDDVAQSVLIEGWAYNNTPWSVSHNCANLAPGDRCQATISFFSNRNGNYSAMLSVRGIEQKPQDAAQLFIKAFAMDDTLRLFPQPLMSWEQARSTGMRMTVLNMGNIPAQISSISSQAGRIELGTCSLTQPLEPTNTCTYLLFPNQTPASETAILESVLRTSRNIEYIGKHRLATNDLYWDGAASSGVVDMGPAYVSFVDPTNSQKVTKQVILRSAGNVPFEAEVTFSLGAGYTVQPVTEYHLASNITCSANVCTLRNQGNYTFKIHYQPQTLGVHSGSIQVSPKGFYAGMAVPELPVVGTGVYRLEPPVTLPSTDFGGTAFDTALGKGRSVTRTITLSTSGTYGAIEGHWELSDTTHFRFSGSTATCASATLERSGVCRSSAALGSRTSLSVAVTVVYQPVSTGQHEVTLRFVPASGTGLSPISTTLRGEAIYDYVPRLVRFGQSTSVPSVIDEGKFHYDPYTGAATSTSTISFAVLPFDTSGNMYSGYGRITGSFELSGAPSARITNFQAQERYSEIGGCKGYIGYSEFYRAKAYRCTFNDRSSLNCAADYIGEGGRYSFGMAGCFADYHFESLRADVSFPGNFLGEQLLTVTYRAADRDTVLSTTIKREGMFDAQYAWSMQPGSTVVPTAANLNFGVAAVNQAVDGSNEAITRTFYIRNTGQWGAIGGDVVIDQSPAFRISKIDLVNDSDAVLGSCSIDAAGKLSSCIAQHGGQGGKHMRLTVTFQPNVQGKHYSLITFVPHPVLKQQPTTLQLEGEGAYNASYVSSTSLTQQVEPPAVFDAGRASYNGPVLGTSQTKTTATIYFLNTGTSGKLAGSVTLGGPGAYNFSIAEWGKIAPNGTKTPCSPTVMCASDSASTSAAVQDNLYVVVNYTPQALGPAQATLTFTPTAATGLPSQSWTLRGEGVYDADGRWRLDLQSTENLTEHAFTTELVKGRTMTYVLKNIGANGQLTGFVQLTGSPNLTLSAVRYVRDDGTVAGSCALSNSFASTLCRAGDAANSLGAKHLQVEVSHTASSGSVVGRSDNATLSFLPHSGMGTAEQSFPITGTFVNEATAQWSSQMTSVVPPDTTFAVNYPSSMTKRFYLKFDGQPTLGVARFALSGDVQHFRILQVGYQISGANGGYCRRSADFSDAYDSYAQIVDPTGDATYDCWAIYSPQIQPYVESIFVDIEYSPIEYGVHTVQLSAVGSQGTTVPQPLTLTGGFEIDYGLSMAWNPQSGMPGISYENSNTVAVFPNGLRTAIGPVLPSTGKVYWEVEFISGSYPVAGVGPVPPTLHIGRPEYAYSCGITKSGADIIRGSGVTSVNTGNGSGNIVGLAYDASARRLDIYRGGVHEGYCVIGGNLPLYIAASNATSIYGSSKVKLRSPSQLSYSPPAGYTPYGSP